MSDITDFLLIIELISIRHLSEFDRGFKRRKIRMNLRHELLKSMYEEGTVIRNN